LTLGASYSHRQGVSNAIRYDSLLVRALARELRDRLLGRPASALEFDRERPAVSLRTGRLTLLWDAHPARGGLHILDDAGRWTGNVALPRARIGDVGAPADERILTFRFEPLDPAAGGARALVLELIAPRWNALALDRDDVILAALRPRAGGARPLVPGERWLPPAGVPRRGAVVPLTHDEWRALLRDVPPDARAAVLLRQVAWTSPLNLPYILSDDSADAAWPRYRALAAGTPAPTLVSVRGGWQPYPFRLDDRSHAPAFDTLIDAFAAVAPIESAPPSGRAADAVRALDRARRRREKVEARLARLHDELRGAAGDAVTLRRHADLLLAQLHRVRRGDAEAALDDFEGGTARVALDPALAPADNAQRLYDAARKRERAAARLPALIARAERDAERIRALEQRIESGHATPDDLDAAPPRAGRTPPAAEERLPYRRYRTSGGLEVRVGRGAASNDELTLRHSAPHDIWMHARDVGGAHVVLRWTERDANPPASDLREAAVLAALHSRARTSGTVPVDWTRRKYVRKPRKAKPGLVLVERAKTLFVQPSTDLERRLRAH
jgi:hypothetical protein